jgi:uncharacterized protein (AIM24 family)
MSIPPGPDRRRGSHAPRAEERRSLPPGTRPSVTADSTRDVAQEDFLFHLYRGSELLQENRVLEAKEELEFALTLQPLDPKGQDLLGAVYFRVGLYPRAIQIYEGLVTQFARDVSIKINLALCYLKTGQPDPARRVLEEAVRLNPEHKRAWGYLGLALQKLGEVEQAQLAFERGGHEMMARRMIEPRPSRPAASGWPSGLEESVRSMAETAFSELDAGELRFALAEAGSSRPGDGPWHTLELGEAASPPKTKYISTLRPHERTDHGAPIPRQPARDGDPAQVVARSGVGGTPAMLVPTTADAVERHATGVLLVRVDEAHAFAGRLESLRVIAGTASTRVLHRRARDAQTSEVLGGIGSPVVLIAGQAQLVLAPRTSRGIELLRLDDDLAFVREDALLGFELSLVYENGRVALDADVTGARTATDGVPVVQLRGRGALVLELAGKLGGVPCTPGRPLLVRREWVIGWLGRLVPRALPATESPNGQRGIIGFSGEGTVLVSPASSQ